MRPKSKAELSAEIKTLQTKIRKLETEVAAQGDTTGAPHLREREFRALVEHCPDIIARFDSALRHSYVSPAVQGVTGLPLQAFIGKTHREMGMPQDLAERWETALRQVFETGQEVCIEFEYLSPDGPRHYESRLSPARAADGTIAAVCSIAREVTDRKRVEEALRESEARFRSLSEHSLDGILLTVPDGRILMASPAACRILGRSEEEICRIGRAGVVDPTDPRLPVFLEERARTGKGRGELRFVRPDGTKCSCEVTSAVFTGRDGLPRTSMCIRDLTERERAEEALRESEARYRGLFEAESDAIFLVDCASYRFLDANAAAVKLYGYSREEFISLKASDVSAEPDKTQHSVTAGDTHISLRWHRRKDGTTFPVEIEGGYYELQGRTIHVAAIRDISERKRAEERLVRLNDCLLNFGVDPAENINRLVALCGEQLGAACALYNRLENGRLCALGQWNVPPDFNPADKPDGHICYDAIRGERSEAWVIRNLPETIYARTDPNVLRYGLRTYVGKPVSFEGVFVGSLCVLYHEDRAPDEEELEFLGIVASAIGVEERRKQAEEGLREQTRLRRIFLDALPCVALLLNRDRVVVAANQAGMNAGAYPGSRCFSTWGQREDPCPWCLAPTALQAGEPQHVEVAALGVVWDAHWIPAGSDLYLHYAFDITESKRAEEALLTRTRQIEAVRAIGEEIARELDLAALLQLITERSAELMGAASGVVALWDEATQLLVPRAWFGLGERLKDLRWKPGEDIPGSTEGATHTAVLAEPLLFGDRLAGVIRIDREAGQQPFTENDRKLLALFATQAAIAIENARLYAGVVRRGEETAALLRASRSLMAGLDLQETLMRIANEAARIARSQHVKVLVCDREKQTLRLGALVGRPPALLDNFVWGSKECLSTIVASTGQPLFVADCGNDPRNPYADQDRALGLVTYLGLPITMHGEVVGVLTVNTSQPREYTSEDFEYLTSFANLSAIAIENARLFEEVRAGRERLQALSHRQLELQESERRLLARELHDEIGQLLTGLKLTLDIVSGEVSDTGRSLLQESQDLVGELIGHVRELSLKLRPAVLDDLGLLPALLWQFERYTTRTQIRVDFQHAGLERRPCPSEVETAAYRIVQEALTNVARHAGADLVQVRLRVERDTLLLQVEDRGHGFEPTITLLPGASSGLAGMHERATLLGGRLRVESSPGAGTRILAELPLGEPERRIEPQSAQSTQRRTRPIQGSPDRTS